jgi:tetratricopeptide (TPR) repeat protein
MAPARVRKVLYPLYILLLLLAVLAVIYTFPKQDELIVLMVVLLFIPGRIQGHFYREFFRGRREMGAGNLDSALAHFTSFVEIVRRRSWTKRLIWLSFGVYTTDIEAMTYNNLGACYLEKGDLKQARTSLYQALEICPTYPIPFFNLALAYCLAGQRREAARSFRKAKQLGYDMGRVDQVLNSLGQRLADIEGYSGPVTQDAETGQAQSNLTIQAFLNFCGMLEEADLLLAQAERDGEPGAQSERASCLMRLGRFEEARPLLQNLSRLGDPTANSLWGCYWACRGDYERALHHDDQAIAAETEPSAALLGNKAETLLLAGRLDGTEKTAREALDAGPCQSAHAVLAQVAVKEERWEEALSYADASLDSGESALALEARGYALRGLGRTEDAVEAFKMFLDLGELIRPLEARLQDRMETVRDILGTFDGKVGSNK